VTADEANFPQRRLNPVFSRFNVAGISMADARILHLYVSAGHNFFGRHGQPPGTHPAEVRRAVECVPGRGIVGDRFHAHEPGHKGQVTFFADEVYDELCAGLAVWDRGPEVFRRNVITRGLDLNTLIGAEFSLQGVRFLGVAECKPCYWMDTAFAPGAEARLRGRGGLRAKVLSAGTLTTGPARLEIHGPAAGNAPG
jgi:MOSC domain-containing protein YiiM